MNRLFKPLLLLSAVVCACSDNSESTSPVAAAPMSTFTRQTEGTPIAGRYIVGSRTTSRMSTSKPDAWAAPSRSAEDDVQVGDEGHDADDVRCSRRLAAQ